MLPPLLDFEKIDDVLYGQPVGHLLRPGRAQPQCASQPGTLHAQMSTQEQVAQYRHLGEQFDVLEGTGQAQAGNPVGSHPHNALTLPADIAFLGPVDLADRVEDRGLARAVGADDGEQLARGHLE